MAHQSTALPIGNPRNQAISAPNSEENARRIVPVRVSDPSNNRSFSSAIEHSFGASQRKISGAATSLVCSVRHFVDERPLHFVGIVAGVALAAGVALRIGRSKRHA